MKKKITFLEVALKVLEITKTALTIDEIWEEAKKINLTTELNSQGKNPKRTLESRIYEHIKNNKNSLITIISHQPKKYILKIYAQNYQNDDFDVEVYQSPSQSNLNFLEIDLHPLLVKYVNGPSFNLHCKTIFHNRSKNKAKGINEWLHPDIVGVYFPFDDFHKETLKFQKNYLGVSKIKIYAFELKRELNFGNIRHAYFQAVSNSSWANEGYLVALHINETEEFMNELKRLNEAFKIGLIKLNAKNIEQSTILFSAKENNNIDWVTFNRMLEDNPDFQDFIKNVSSSIKINQIVGDYDQIFNEEQYQHHLKTKKII